MTEKPYPATTRAATRKIALINASSLVTDEECARAVKALNKQVDVDLSPIWNVNCSLVAVPLGKKPPKDSWWLTILDDSDWAGALGYHDLSDEGYPAGKIFVRTSQRYGEPWTVTASHELLEMLVDPYVYLTAGPDHNGLSWAYELCDPPQDESYKIDGVEVSNFVHPAWFGTGPSYQGKYDHLGTIKAPFELRPNGYISVYQPGKGWTDQFGQKKPSERTLLRARKPQGSRKSRRWAMLPDDQLLLSKPNARALRGMLKEKGAEPPAEE
jgi:hypothetical protein